MVAGSGGPHSVDYLARRLGVPFELEPRAKLVCSGRARHGGAKWSLGRRSRGLAKGGRRSWSTRRHPGGRPSRARRRPHRAPRAHPHDAGRHDGDHRRRAVAPVPRRARSSICQAPPGPRVSVTMHLERAGTTPELLARITARKGRTLPRTLKAQTIDTWASKALTRAILACCPVHGAIGPHLRLARRAAIRCGRASIAVLLLAVPASFPAHAVPGRTDPSWRQRIHALQTRLGAGRRLRCSRRAEGTVPRVT
jgi:hypothetical protein